MEIVNICLAGSFNYGWGYQDNLISKYQHKNGNDVTLITTRFINDKKGDGYLEVPAEIKFDNGVKVIRLEHGLGRRATKLFRHYRGLYKTLKIEKPDFIFIHGLQFLDILYVCKYLRENSNVSCCVDNHADYTNSAKTKFSYFIHKTLWRYCAMQINKYASVFYGVLPIRCDFIKDMYGISADKIELLAMGADDELLEIGKKKIQKIRRILNITEGDFVIITGGKIDIFKSETISLMKAVNEIENENIKLLVFGSIAKELEESFNAQLSEKVKYIGWLDQKEIYNYICASDLGFFPGRHSVIWEQIVASGIPCVFRRLPKTDHIDIGGNCLFLEDGSELEIKKTLKDVLRKDIYIELKKRSLSPRRNEFLYSQIAQKSIKDVQKVQSNK